MLHGDTAGQWFDITTHTISFRGCRIGLAFERMDNTKGKPLDVDYLFIVRGWNRPLSELLQTFRPNAIILDASLSDFYARRFAAEADSIGIPCHNIRSAGGVVVELWHGRECCEFPTVGSKK